MRDTCRVCARQLWGNQRRWIFRPGAKVSLQVLLSRALGRVLTRDGRSEFCCSRCSFLLDRMFRCDTVAARVQLLSLQQLQRLLHEKERLRVCVAGQYRRNNPEPDQDQDLDLDLTAPRGGGYSDLVQDDLAYSMYESWADQQWTGPDSGLRSRRCRGCAALRVPDPDYEAVCKVPRRTGGRSTSCGPATRFSLGWEDPRTSAGPEGPPGLDLRTPSPASSAESLDLHRDQVEPEPEEASGEPDPPWDKPGQDFWSGLDLILTLLRTSEYRPVKTRRGSKLPVLVRSELDQVLSRPPRPPCQLDPQRAGPEVLAPCPDLVLQDAEDWLDEFLQLGPVLSQLVDQDPGGPGGPRTTAESRKVLLDEQQVRLGRFEGEAGRGVVELQKVQIQESQTRTQELQERLLDLELQLGSARQNLSETVRSKEEEVSELHRVIEDQNQMLASLREFQRSGPEADPAQLEVLVLQASLELQAGQRAQRQAARAQENQNRALERLERDLQEALQQRREAERHNQQLQLVLQEVRSVLQEKEEQLRENQQESQREQEEHQRSLQELRASLRSKEVLVEEYRELLAGPKETGDSQVLRLRQRITERDRTLERAVDQRFRSEEQKEEQNRRLQLLLRDKDRDLDRQCCVLSNNEDTIASLEALLRGKVLELDRVAQACRNVQSLQRDAEDRQNRTLRERDAVMGRLQEALLAQTQEVQDLRASLLAQVHSAPGPVLEELKLRLQLKDRLFQEVLADGARQAREHEEQTQDLLRTISCRDQYLQDSASRFGEVLAEQRSRLQELRRQLSSGSGSGPERTVELQVLQEELRLALRREKENQDLSWSRAAQLDSLSRTLDTKEDLIRDLQGQLADPADLPLVERLTQEVQELREVLVQQDALAAGGPVPSRDRQPEFGGGHERSVGRCL